MHFQLLTTLTLAGLVFAHPFTTTNITTTSFQPLEKRDSWPWIGSHFLRACATKGVVLPKQMHGLPQSVNKYMAGDRPKLAHDHCQPFAPQTEYIGFSWGAGPLQFGTLMVFDKSDCSGKPVAVITRKGFEAGACFTRHDAPGMSAVMATEAKTVVH